MQAIFHSSGIRRFLFGNGAFFFFLFLSIGSARALTFNFTYDASVTNLGTLAQVQTAVGYAAQSLQSLYTNAITVNVTVYSAGAGPFGNINLGQSQTEFTYNPTAFKYPQLTNALRAARTTAADTNSVASLPATDPTGGSLPWLMPRAEAKALGVLNVSPTATNADGEIGFATNVAYAFDATNRAVAGKFDFIGVALHELSEVLGRGFALNYGIGGYQPFDLFRFTNSGARSFGVNDTNVYFSVDNGATALKYFYTNVLFGDIQDWNTSSPSDAYDAYLSPNQKSALSSADLTTLDILGYSLNFNPPRLAGVRAANGSFQLTFTNVTGLNFSILASTNIALTATNWTVLGAPAENPVGQYQFTDPSTNSTRFYRMRLN
jgi:hypothetical protein